MQTSLFPPKSNWRPPASLKIDGSVFAIDLETRDPELKTRGPSWTFGEGYPVGVGVSNGRKTIYMPFQHAGGGNLDEGIVKRAVSKITEDSRNTLIFHNAPYDIGWLNYWGVECFGTIHDTAIMAPLLDEHRFRYNLDSLLQDYLGIKKDEKLLRKAAADFGIDPKSDMWKLHSKYVGPYGEGDAFGTFKLFEKLWPMMLEQELDRVYEVEMAQIPVILEMRKRGVRVDLDKADRLKKKFMSYETENLEEIFRLTGLKPRHGVPTADAAQILRKVGIRVPTTSNNNDSVTAGFLETQTHKAAVCILKARKFNKAYRDFIVSGIFNRHHKGRIHATFTQLKNDDGGTVSGRYASSNPNLQQIPARDKNIGPPIRSLYLPEEGCRWVSIDYASQEPRWTVWWAWVSRCPGAIEALKAFQNNPRTDYHQWVADLMSIERRPAKDINLGLAYGMGEVKLCQELGLPTMLSDNGWERAGPEAQEILTKFHRKVPYMKRLSNLCINRAKNRGYIKTYLGRRAHFTGDMEFVALNRLIQGSSADQLKVAIAKCGTAGHPPLALVHDENCFSFETDAQIKQCKDIMENCVDIEMPFVTDVAIGPNWGDAKE